MEYGDVIHTLRLKDESKVLQEYWDESQASYPGNTPCFLENTFIYEMIEFLNLPDEAVSKLIRAAGIIRQDEALARLIWHRHYVLFHLDGYPDEYLRRWPSLSSYNQTVADMFFALLGISGIPRMQEIYKKRDIPLEIFCETLDYLRVWMMDYYSRNGRWGFSNFVWFKNYQLAGRIFRLGRLEFEHNQFKGNVKVYQNINSGKIIALSDHGIEFRSDGQVNGTNEIYDEDNKWVSVLTEKNGVITGNPIHPSSYAINNIIRLPAKEWTLVLEKGDPVLQIHIPATGRLTPELVTRSFDYAIEFFSKYFPDKPFKAICCGTWFLDSQFGKLLGPDSNIVKFQEFFYLYPSLTNDNAVFYWVFGGKLDNLSSLPRKTELHRAILSHYESGGHLRTGTGFILVSGNKWEHRVAEEYLS